MRMLKDSVARYMVALLANVLAHALQQRAIADADVLEQGD